MNMKKILSVALPAICLFTVTAFSSDNPTRSPQTVYIDRYAALAVEEMYRSGVPASITLAQGLLESRYGQSELAVKGNNHFGIKCHNWKGKKMYHDDDRDGECFRVYASPEESFRDHSDFLRYRDRYKFLFDLEPTDYEGWAHGLRKAGYATDPAYPKKLIRLIEDYELHQYDSKPSSWGHSSGRPESPNAIEQAKPLDRRQRETFHFALSRQMFSLNGVPFVIASEGETYAGIADSYNLFLKEILRFNDLDREQILHPGTIVYLQAKKKRAASGLEKHVVDGDDENLWEISQRYAVKLERLCRMNGVSPDRKLNDGEVIILRK